MINKKFTPEEIRQLDKVSVRERSTEGILFGYAQLSTCGFYGDMGGFSFIIYDCGKVEIREYLFPDLLAEERLYNVPESCIYRIKELYHNSRDEIETLELPSNGSYDGSFNHFFFGGQWLSGLNVYYRDENAVSDTHKNDPKKAERLLSVTHDENKVLRYFDMVCGILKEYDIVLSLGQAAVKGETTGVPAGFYDT